MCIRDRLDPPYHHGTVAAILPAVAQVLAPGGVVLAETERGAQLPEACGALRLVFRIELH